MSWMVYRVILRRLVRCGTLTCLKLLTGAGGVLSFLVLAVYTNPETPGLSSQRLVSGSCIPFPDVLFSAVLIVLSAGLYYIVDRYDSRGRYAEVLLRRLYGERRGSLAATRVAETFLVTGAAVIAGLVLIDIAYYYLKIPADGWKMHLPGLLVKSALMGLASGAAVACQACRHSITVLLVKLREQHRLQSRDLRPDLNARPGVI